MLLQTSQVIIKPPLEMKGSNESCQLKYKPVYPQPKNITNTTNKSSLQAFVDLLVNVHHLISTPSSQASYPKYFTEHSIINHLQKSSKSSHLQSQNLISNNNTLLDTFNKTGPTVVEDEDSQYQTYLKEYQSVIKNSRRKQYISPVSHKQQINQLISEFLSEKPNTDDDSANNTDNRKCKNITAVKIQKVDLDSLRVNHPKSIRPDNSPRKITPNKNGSSKSKKKGRCSPRFVNLSAQNITPQPRRQTKSPNSSTITVVKVQKPKLAPQHQQIIVQYPSRPTAKGQYKQTYLKKKTAQLEKTEPLFEKVERIAETSKIAATNKHQRSQQQRIARKPIKIQIQIPLQDSEQQEQDTMPLSSQHMQTSKILQMEQQQIIKQISERVLTLLHKTKQAPNPNT